MVTGFAQNIFLIQKTPKPQNLTFPILASIPPTQDPFSPLKLQTSQEDFPKRAQRIA
ncbi:unnamed protein product [Moneuplotes crassus]|uniref:Uncharacterized protein n=1 Tax=Euplotes crassus TaxID=5936 RepID=A0AAD1U3V3_EUPCR|nr:unnamed protein product [Moneuplotes crassus]